jgi:hypothetical protein
VKQGATSTLVQPFRTKQFDRTNGALEISFGPFSQKKVLAQFSVVVADGPDLTVSGNIDPPARLALYRRIAIAKNAFDVVSADTRPDAAIRAKTLATAVHALSASAVQEKYPQVVRQLLQTEAQAIAAADNLGRDIRDLIVANDMLTPEQITTFKERINIALETAPPELKPQLERIKAEIELEERAATQLESAVRVLRDNFETDLDRMIAEYQSLVLEYAQYIPASELAAQSPVPAPTRARLANVLRPADVMIGDAALGGRGAAIRAAFGVTAAAR